MSRPSKGRFKKGESGNPSGRPKGARNQITLLRQSLELDLREQSKEHLPAVLMAAIELAKAGDRQMIKLLLDLHMSKGAAEEQKAVEKQTILIGTVKEVEVTPVSLEPESILPKGEILQ